MSRVQVSFEKLRPDLIRLGFAYYGQASEKSPDPEKTIMSVCALWCEDRKVFKILLTWTTDIHTLIQVERLKALCEDANLTQTCLLGLYIVCSKLLSLGDLRFKTLPSQLSKRINPKSKELDGILHEISDPYLTHKYG